MTKNNILDFIYRAYDDHKMFESILVESSNDELAKELLMEVVRYMYCDNHSKTDDGCEWCNKVKNNSIQDLLTIGNGLTSISKDEIQDMINQFSSSSKEEDKPKTVIINTAENLKVDAANSLLKFLEEPDENTFLFLITKNKNDVLPTIKSRAKIFNLEQDNEAKEENYIVKVIKSKNKNNILLLNNKMKKESKEELAQDLLDAQSYFLNENDIDIYEALLDLISDVKFGNNVNLAIDNFLVRVVNSYEN